MNYNYDDIDWELETVFEDQMSKVYDSSSSWVWDSMKYKDFVFDFNPKKYFKNKIKIKNICSDLTRDVDLFYKELNTRHKITSEDDDIIGKWVDTFKKIDDGEEYDSIVDKYTGIVYLRYFSAMKNEIETIEYTLYEIIDETAREIIGNIFGG